MSTLRTVLKSVGNSIGCIGALDFVVPPILVLESLMEKR